MTKREFYVLIEKGKDGYLIADVPELPADSFFRQRRQQSGVSNQPSAKSRMLRTER